MAFAKMKIDVEFTRHFLDRVNDARNKKQITADELKMLFGKVAKKHAGKIRMLGDKAEHIINSLNTDINSPFVLKLDRDKGWLDMTMKTVMRKKNFRIGKDQKKFTVEQDLEELRVQKPQAKDTLGIRREYMPQVASKDYPELFIFLQKAGAKLSNKMVAAHELKPIQKEFSDQGVTKSIGKGLSLEQKPLIMSSDGYIIDGHHRWLSVINTKPKKKIPVIRVNVPVRKLLALVKAFPGTTYKDIYTETRLETSLKKMSEKWQ
jgi:hypothetical protein